MLSIARLEAASGNESASERALQQYASTHPWIPKYIDQQRAFGQLSAALARNDGRRVLAAADRLSSLTAPGLLFAKATGSLLSQDSASAERGFQRTIVENRLPQSGDFGATLPLVPLYSILTRYYLGQVYEATGKPQQAIDEYESFLSHFEGSQAALSQVEKARRSEEADAIVSDGLRPRLVVRRSNSQVLAVRSFPNLRCCSSSKSVGVNRYRLTPSDGRSPG